MKKVRFLKRKNLMKITTIAMVLLVAFTLISSTSISLTLNIVSKTKKIETVKIDKKISNGLAPRSEILIKTSSAKSNIITEKSPIGPFGNIMYGYNADPGPEGTIYFDVDDPGTIEECGETISGDFLAGGTFSCDDVWYACQYGSGLLYGINPYNDCEMWVIGGGGIGMNGLAYNPVDNRMYGSGDDNYLYEIDPDTGEQELIGPFENGVEYMIGMAFDYDGTLYGWDLGNDNLWTIDKETGEATEIGPLGIDLNYAQDGDFHRESDTLYLTAYTSSGQLGTVDKETGTFTLIGSFEGGMEITASIFINSCFFIDHDVALRSIDYPETGPATPDMKMQTTVKNTGNNTETFDVQMEINNYKPGKFLLDEGFEGDFPPEGWETDCWTQCNDDCSPDPPCACVYGDDQGENDSNYIISKPVNASEYNKCTLRFYFDLDTYHGSFYVLIRRSENEPWKDVTPWENPVGENQDGELYEIGIYDFGEGCGEALQIAWRYYGDSYYLDRIVLDSVKLYGCEIDIEYAELVEDFTLEPGEKEQIEFPTWTPSKWQNESYENTWVEYLVHAFVICEGDQNPRNDDKYKLIDLYFGYFHDVGCNNISGPESGLAQKFPVTCHVKNFGQYSESGFNTFIEIAELDIENSIELLNEDFTSSTFPPDGWTKTHNNWMHSQTNKAGGVTGEARFFYYPSSIDTFRLFTPEIDTSEYNIIDIDFKHYVDHYNDKYNLKLELSEDGIDWITLWEIEPSENVGPESINIVTDKNISSNVYISWTFEGNSYNINNWYVDDIVISGLNLLSPEYEDNSLISTIEPGEELKIDLSDWTPEFLQYEITGFKNYIVKGWTELVEPEDKNPDNDLFKKLITLDYLHDVGIYNISSPLSQCHSNRKNNAFGLPWPDIYILPGTQHVDVNVVNNGTFPEYDLTCNAEIWDFNTDPENGTLLYWDYITNIDLEEPVGGTKLLNFDDFTFTEEGVYELYLDFPHEIDEYPENNNKSLIIGVDDTAPYAWIEEINPPEPDGENGWYVSNVMVTICAEDPEIAPGIPGSGVVGFHVRVNSGVEQFIEGDCITIILTEDCDDILVEYWAVDCVGNLGPMGSFTINIDQTVPDISLSYEYSGNKWQGWEFIFTATATDAISDMNRVEFYLNDLIQETIVGPGPEYVWTIKYDPIPNAHFKAKAFDNAGLFCTDEIIDPTVSPHSHSKIIYNFFQNLLRLYEQFPILQRLFLGIEGI